MWEVLLLLVGAIIGAVIGVVVKIWVDPRLEARGRKAERAPYTFGLFEALSNYRTFELLRPHCDKSRYSGRGNLRRTSQAVVSLVSLRIAL
jgi:hypothetical protein